MEADGKDGTMTRAPVCREIELERYRQAWRGESVPKWCHSSRGWNNRIAAGFLGQLLFWGAYCLSVTVLDSMDDGPLLGFA